MTGAPRIAKVPAPARPVPGAHRVFPFDRPGTVLASDGRTAIRAGLRALGFPAGGLVLVPSWHCGSEVDAILAEGGRVEPFGLTPALAADPAALEARLKKGGVWAVYLIHYFGYPQPVAEIARAARTHGVRVIEDLALGLFSTRPDGTPLGTDGDMTIFSFVKTLALTDGGAVWLNPEAGAGPLPRLAPAPPAADLRAMRSLLRRMPRRRGPATDPLAGQGPRDLDAWDPAAGVTPDAPLQGASRATRAILAGTDGAAIARGRASRYRMLETALSGIAAAGPLLPPLPEGAAPAFFPLHASDQDAVVAALARSGVEPVRFWRRFHPAVDLSEFPEAAALRRAVIRLPVHDRVDADAVTRIRDAVRRA